MAATVLSSEARSVTGKRNMIRLRAAGKVPAVLCERGKPSLNLTVGSVELRKAVNAGAHLVDLKSGDDVQKALVKKVQWDIYGETIIHVDFQKVSLTEKVQVEVEVVLKGKPVGVSEEKGVLMHHAHVLTISCLPTAIPHSLTVDVTAMKMHDVLHASAVKLPEGVTMVTDAAAVVCTVVPPKTEEQATAEAAPAVTPTTAEPELIRKERKEEEPEEGAAAE